MGHRFEFDPVNKILLMRVEGRLTDESLAELYRTAQKWWAATDAARPFRTTHRLRSGLCPPNSYAKWQMRNQP